MNQDRAPLDFSIEEELEEHIKLLMILSVIDNCKWKRLSDAISLLWGNVECEEYLHKLLNQTEREGKLRRGFPSNIHQIIWGLYDIHTSIWQFNFKKTVWSLTAHDFSRF